jgi:hypothetical protein
VDIDPMERVENPDDAADRRQSAANARLNTYVAITVALLATFTGICKVKDDNIVQAMQQAQADKLDHWSFYQARNIRLEVAEAAAAELAASRGRAGAATLDGAIARYRAIAVEQAAKKDSLQRLAISDQQRYDALNYRDDQFDLSDALVALSISLLALTALTHKSWLYRLALVPTLLGVLMGLAGLFGWHIHPDALVKWLS